MSAGVVGLGKVRGGGRWLLWHPESGCLFEVREEGVLAQMLAGDGLCEEVTGIVEYEEKFKKQCDGEYDDI